MLVWKASLQACEINFRSDVKKTRNKIIIQRLLLAFPHLCADSKHNLLTVA